MLCLFWVGPWAIYVMFPFCFLHVIFGFTSAFWESLFQGYIGKFQTWKLIRGYNILKYILCLISAFYFLLRVLREILKLLWLNLFIFYLVVFPIIILDSEYSPHSRILVRAQICFLLPFNISVFPNLICKHRMKWENKLIFLFWITKQLFQYHLLE